MLNLGKINRNKEDHSIPFGFAHKICMVSENVHIFSFHILMFDLQTEDQVDVDDLTPLVDEMAECTVDQDRYVNTDILEFLLKQDRVDVNHENDVCYLHVLYIHLSKHLSGFVRLNHLHVK